MQGRRNVFNMEQRLKETNNTQKVCMKIYLQKNLIKCINKVNFYGDLLVIKHLLFPYIWYIYKPRVMKREEILSRILEEQYKVISNLQNSVNLYKKESDKDEDDTSDPDDYARQTEAKDMQLRFEKMLSKEKADLNFVLGEKDKNYAVAEHGALVETENNYFFLGVALPAFKYNDKDVYCISPEAPIYAKIRGKKQGDSLQMGDRTLEIIGIS